MPVVRYDEPIDYVKTGQETWTYSEVYEDNTFIDWMKESRPIADTHSSSKKWTILVITSLAVGYTTVFIDLASVWLNDFKKGLCFSKLDKWSLLNPYSTCPADDWYDWSKVIAGKDTTLSSMFFDFPIYLFFVCLFVFCASLITFKRAPLVKQSGIPEMKLIIAGLNYYTDSYLGPSMFFYKITGLILVVSSGVWLGKEGPLVHISCCILTICFDRVYAKKRLEGLRRELLSAAVATGIAVAFSSPIGGVLFVLELLPSYFTPVKLIWGSFVSATISLVAVYGFKAFTEGKNFNEDALFQVSFGNFSWLFMETIPFLFLGIIGGFFGYAYTKTYLLFSNKLWKNKLWSALARLFGTSKKNASYIEIILVAIATAFLTFPISMTKLPLSAYLKLLYTDCATDVSSSETNSTNFMCSSSSLSTVFKLGYIFVQGFILSSYSYGLSLPGGVLMPSFVLGGTLGRLVGIVSQAIQNNVDASYFSTCTAKSCIVSPSSYAVVGSAAFVTGITKLTLSVVVIIFELTGAVTYVLPIMIAVMTAKFFNDWLCEDNIYDAWIHYEFNVPGSGDPSQVNSGKGDGLCNFDTLSARTRAKLPDVSVATVMLPIAETKHLYVFPREPYVLQDLYRFLSDDNNEGYPLIASETNWTSVGYLTKKSIYRSIVQSVGNVQATDILLSFQVDFPQHLIDLHAQFQQHINDKYEKVYSIAIELEKPTVILDESGSLKQAIELFEKLHLNYLTVTRNTNQACGFIDRYMLASLIHSRFQQLQETRIDDECSFSEFQVED